MSNKPNAVVFDCDDILLWWTKAFQTWHTRTYGELVLTETYTSLDALMGCNLEQACERFYEFNTTSVEFGTMQPYGYAADAITLIVKHNQYALPENKINIIVCSKSPNEMTSLMMRKVNLIHVFGDVFDEVHCIGDNPKGPVLLELSKKYNIRLFVDDHHKNIINVVE